MLRKGATRIGMITLAAAFAALIACAGPQEAPKTRSSTGRDFAPRITTTSIGNLAQISDRLYRGAQPSPEGLKDLERLGVKTIINLRSHHSERTVAEAMGFRVIELPMQADIFGSAPPTDAQLEEFFRIVLDPKSGPVFFHCAHGKDRTGTMAALYRIEVDGWSNEEAVEEMRAFGYHTIYKDLIAYVKAYQPRGFAKR